MSLLVISAAATSFAALSEFDWVEFSLAVLFIELTPGPNMAWLAALSLSEGRTAGLAATAGIAIGLAINAIAAALGLAALVAANPGLQTWLRWAGVALMLWLAWEAWRGAGAPKAQRGGIPDCRREFTSGLLVNLLNSKAILFFMAVVPPFLNGREATFPQALVLAFVSVFIATCVHLAIVLGAAKAHGWMNNTERITLVRRTMALLLVGVALWLAQANPA